MSDVNGQVPRRVQPQRALLIALVANACFLLCELAGGIAFRSLALLADGAHMASDVVALGVAWAAQSLMRRPASAKHSFGLKRVEVLAALFNAVLLLAAAGWIVWEAVDRVGEPQEVVGGGLLLVACGGLLVNLGSAFVLSRAGENLNLRAALTHMTMDALGSVGVIVVALSVLLWSADWLDPVVSIAIAALVVWSAWRLLRDTVHVLLEGTPQDMDPAEVDLALRSDPDVESVHHLHLWNIASDMPALSAHVVLAGEVTLHEAQVRGDALKRMLGKRFGIEHSTLELECHACEPEVPSRVPSVHRAPPS